MFIVAECSNTIHGNRAAPLSARPVMRADQWAEYGRRLTRLADATLAEGLRLVYHHHMGTIVQTEAEIDALMASVGPSAHLLLDTGHATWGGADPAALARRYRSRISHVHTKDVRADVREKGLNALRQLIDEIDAGRQNYGAMPLIVLTADGSYSKAPPAARAALDSVWAGLHRQVAARSTRGSAQLVAGSSHMMIFDRPDAIAAAINEVIAAAR